MEVVASLSQGRAAAAQCGLFTYKSVPVIFEPPCICIILREFQSCTSLKLLSIYIIKISLKIIKLKYLCGCCCC